MKYKIQGKFKVRFDWEYFTKIITSQNEKNAIEKVYSIIGSQHHLERRLIEIIDISKLEDE